MTVLGGSSWVVYDATNDPNYKVLGGSAIPVYITGLGAINSDPVPPYDPFLSQDVVLVSSADYLTENGVDYIAYQV